MPKFVHQIPNQPTYAFETDFAQILGIVESIVLHQLIHLTSASCKKERLYHDGQYWVRSSYQGWCRWFPWWSVATIKRALKKLEEKGVVVTGDFNADRMVRTKWYRADLEFIADAHSFIAEQREISRQRKAQEESLDQGKRPARKQISTAYAKYLQTDYWVALRQEMIDQFPFCQDCGKEHAHLNVHHRYYSKNGVSVLFHEREYPDLLIVLCPKCHLKQHPEVLQRG